MLLVLLACCCQLTTCAAEPEPRSGRSLSDERFGPLDSITLLHEEYYLSVGEVFNGKVIAKTEDTITIQKWRSVARVFRVSPTLTSDRIPLESRRLGTGHRLSHIRIGDMVGFDVARARDGYVIVSFGIYRRPGGKIPEAEDDHLPAKSRLHNRCMSEQIVEEVLVPKLLPFMVTRFLHYGAPRP